MTSLFHWFSHFMTSLDAYDVVISTLSCFHSRISYQWSRYFSMLLISPYHPTFMASLFLRFPNLTMPYRRCFALSFDPSRVRLDPLHPCMSFLIRSVVASRLSMVSRKFGLSRNFGGFSATAKVTVNKKRPDTQRKRLHIGLAKSYSIQEYG